MSTAVLFDRDDLHGGREGCSGKVYMYIAEGIGDKV